MASDAVFYYSEGSTVSLEPTRHRAVDLEAAREADMPSGLLDHLRARGRLLRGSLTMVDSDELTPDAERRLEAAGAVRPVYRAEDGALIVVLPEVRVEASDEQEISRVRRLVEGADIEATIVQRRPQQLTIHLDRAAGNKTLDLANQIEEEIHPPMSQARFVRIIPRPPS